VGKLANEERKNMDAKLQLWKQGEEASDASAKTVEAAAEGDQRAKRSRPSKQHALQQPPPPSLAGG